MSFETAPLRGVKAQYGTRQAGGLSGETKTEGLTYEAVVNFDGDKLHGRVTLPEGAVVTYIKKDFAVGSVTLVNVVASDNTSQDISTAIGTDATRVPVPKGGVLNVEGPTGGSVIVEYEFTV